MPVPDLPLPPVEEAAERERATADAQSDLPAALRQAVLASPVAGPARSVHRRLRRRR